MSAPLFERPLAGGGLLVVDRDADHPAQLVVSLMTHPVAIAGPISRDDVQQLAQALDDWLFDSRP
jgi:hypothetical protein